MPLILHSVRGPEIQLRMKTLAGLPRNWQLSWGTSHKKSNKNTLKGAVMEVNIGAQEHP